MSESNLAYNNDGSMNTSADYLGKFLTITTMPPKTGL